MGDTANWQNHRCHTERQSLIDRSLTGDKMSSIDMFLRFSRYNSWMNESLYDVCSRLSEDELKLDMKSFFRSIHGTLNHILLADKVWLGRLTDHLFTVHPLDQTLYVDFPPLAQARKQ